MADQELLRTLEKQLPILAEERVNPDRRVKRGRDSQLEEEENELFPPKLNPFLPSGNSNEKADKWLNSESTEIVMPQENSSSSEAFSMATISLSDDDDSEDDEDR